MLKKSLAKSNCYLMIIVNDQDRIRNQASAQLGGAICSVISSIEHSNIFFSQTETRCHKWSNEPTVNQGKLTI